MLLRICFTLLLLTNCIALAAQDEGETALQWGYMNFPPRLYQGASLQPSGELAEVVKGVLREMDVAWDAKQFPNRRLSALLNQGAIDLALITPSQLEAPEGFVISETVFGIVELYAYWLKASTPGVHQLADLRHKRLIVLSAYVYGGLRHQEPDIFHDQLVTVEDHPRALLALLLGRGEYLLNYRRPVDSIITEQESGRLGRFLIERLAVKAVMPKSVAGAKTLISEMDHFHRTKYPQHYARYADLRYGRQ